MVDENKATEILTEMMREELGKLHEKHDFANIYAWKTLFDCAQQLGLDARAINKEARKGVYDD